MEKELSTNNNFNAGQMAFLQEQQDEFGFGNDEIEDRGRRRTNAFHEFIPMNEDFGGMAFGGVEANE